MTHSVGSHRDTVRCTDPRGNLIGACFLLLIAPTAALITLVAGFSWTTTCFVGVAVAVLAAWIAVAAYAPSAARVLTLLGLVLIPLAGLMADRVLTARAKSELHQQMHHLREVGGALQAREAFGAQSRLRR